MMRILISIFILLSLTACAQVKPWERGQLAKPIMSWQPMAQKGALNNHIYFSKEGSSGGGAAVGGGCGCN